MSVLVLNDCQPVKGCEAARVAQPGHLGLESRRWLARNRRAQKTSQGVPPRMTHSLPRFGALLLAITALAQADVGALLRAYAGAVLARAGFVLAPSQLSFAQTALDRYTHEGKLRDDVAERWSRVGKDHLEQLTLSEAREDVQVARLAAVELHVRDRRKAAEQELSRL